ncbi:MAG: hypothetical protein KGL53_08805, partial [Elusimicrobia bacterium]|nr:hypothetical protein [Elusimicrobiota bacterium]
GDGPERAGGRGVVLGLLAGYAAGTKFNVLPAAGVLLLAHAWLTRRAGGGWRPTLLMGAALGAAVAPWLLKDLWFYGNPVYPFLYKHLGRFKPADWQAFMGSAGSRDLRATFTSVTGFWDFLTFPFRCTLGSWPLGDWPGPVLVPLAALALCVRWGWRDPDSESPPAWRAAAGLAAAGGAAWWLASSLVRYVVPSLPVLAAAGALALEKAAWPRRFKDAVWAAALVGSLLAFQSAWRQGQGLWQWAYVRGEVPRDAYLSEQRVTYGLPPYPAYAWADAHLPADAKVLLIGESRGYYLERDFIAPTVYDANPFWTAAAAAKDADELRARLKALGVTHIILSARELHYHFDSPAVLPRAAAGKPLVNAFFHRWLDQLWELRRDGGPNPCWLDVYALRDSPNPGPGPVDPVDVVLEVLRRQGR